MRGFLARSLQIILENVIIYFMMAKILFWRFFMHIRVKKDILKDKLKKVIKFSGDSLPTSGILLKADSNRFEIFSTNLNYMIILPVDADIEESGYAYVEGKNFFSIIDKLRYNDLDIFVKDDKLFLKSDKGKSKINIELSTKNPESIVPDFSVIEDSGLIEVEPSVISDIFKKTKDIPDTAEPRIVFSGVFLEFKDNLLVGVATDSRKMTLVQKSTNDFLKSNKVIIPIEFVKIILKDLEETSSLKIGFKENMLWFVVDEFVVATKIIEEKFPNYEVVIPKEMMYGFQVNKDELISVIKEGLSISERGIIFSIKQDTIDIIAEMPDVGKLIDVIDIEPVGQVKEEKICLNGEYLLDILGGIDSEKVNIFYISPEAPVKILIPDDNHYLSLLMPMKI